MKKLILGVFLVASALSFSAERKVQVEQVFKNANTDIVYVQGEQTPYTGIIEIKFPNGKTQALMAYKNGVMHGKGITYYPSGKLLSEITFKNDKEEGIMKAYFENGKLQLEIPYKNGQVDGLVKRYDENGQVVEQATFKNGQEVKTK